MKHAHRSQMNRFLFSALMVGCFACLVLVSTAFAKKSNDETIQHSVKKHAVLFQGFEPSSEVYYSIFSATDVIVEGDTKTDSEGNLLVEYTLPVSNTHAQRIYDFKISRDNDYANILIRQNLKSGKITITGNGLKEFSEVSLIAPDKKSITKTDWSGGVFESETLKKETEEDYQIALHGFSAIGAPGEKQNPAIIKVLAAPGGGFSVSTPNNIPTMTPSQPSSGIWPLSTSNLAPFTAYTQAIVNNYIQALMLMTEQLNAVVMQQTLAIGQFFDAKIQLEVQRTHQQLKAEAVKDYHPSEQMCRYGSYVRSLAKTEQKSLADKLVLNDALMERYKNLSNNTASTPIKDIQGRLKQYREIYCNPKDNNNSLGFLCEHDQDRNTNNSTFGNATMTGMGGRHDTTTYGPYTAPPGAGGPAVNVVTTRINKDVDFTRTMDYPLTLDIDMNDGVDANDEEDVLALAKNLYWPTSIKHEEDDQKFKKRKIGFLEAQRVIALKNMAHNSYTNLAALKARSAAVAPAAGGGAVVEPGWTFMKTLMLDFGISEAEIEQMVGVQPSYWAQMDILTKKIYQLPSFYTNLYDKPVNVERIGVTLDAIKLMQMRDYYTSFQRREMLNSALLETELVRGNHYSRAESAVLFGGLDP